MADKENLEQEVAESTSAAASLKPGVSKSELLSQMMKVIGGMKKEDLSAFLTKTLAQVGKEDDTVPNTSAKHQSSVAMKPGSVPSPDSAGPYAAVKEDVAEMFGDQEDLSEEFKTRASALFEAAVGNRVSIEVARLEEEFEEKVEAQVTESVEEMHSQVESYIDYVAEKWIEENRVAIESNYRSEITENFITGLKKLFEENYVEVPEEKVDLIGEMETRISELEESLETIEADNVRLSKELHENALTRVFDEITEDLVDTQIEKFRSLAESLSYDNTEEYRTKLEVIKEEYFSDSTSDSKGSTGLIDEDFSVGSNEEQPNTVFIPEEMQSYVSAISKTIKK